MASSIVEHYLGQFFADGDSRIPGAESVHNDYLSQITSTDNAYEATKLKNDFYKKYFSVYSSYDSETYSSDGDVASAKYSVDENGLYINIEDTKDGKASYYNANLSTISNKLNVLKYGSGGSYHLEDTLDQNGNVTSYGIDYYINNASSDEKTILEAKKAELVAERDKWSSLYDSEQAKFNETNLSASIEEKRAKLANIFAKGSDYSEHDAYYAANSLATAEIQYFNEFESKTLTGDELSVRQSQIDALKSAFAGNDQTVESISTQTIVEKNLKPWEKGLGSESMSEAERNEYMKYFESKFPDGSAKGKISSDYTETDFTKDKSLYLQCKRDNGISLTDDEKAWSVSTFENKTVRINSAADAKAYNAEKSVIDQYKKDLGITEKTMETDKSISMTEAEVPLAETPVVDAAAEVQAKKNPYEFSAPERADGMSDADYAALCNSSEQAYIDEINDKMADAVIRGDYGVGQDRIQRLEAEGYDYSQIQARVNEKMSSYQTQTAVEQPVAISSEKEAVVFPDSLKSEVQSEEKTVERSMNAVLAKTSKINIRSLEGESEEDTLDRSKIEAKVIKSEEKVTESEQTAFVSPETNHSVDASVSHIEETDTAHTDISSENESKLAYNPAAHYDERFANVNMYEAGSDSKSASNQYDG